jgi:hypothetical protein
MKYHYAITGLQEPNDVNVMSLEQKTFEGCTLKSDETENLYRVVRCGEPFETKREATLHAVNGKVTLWVELASRGPGYLVCPVHETKMERTTDWDMRTKRWPKDVMELHHEPNASFAEVTDDGSSTGLKMHNYEVESEELRPWWNKLTE